LDDCYDEAVCISKNYIRLRTVIIALRENLLPGHIALAKRQIALPDIALFSIKLNLIKGLFNGIPLAF
jgi:hypothetical protein